MNTKEQIEQLYDLANHSSFTEFREYFDEVLGEMSRDEAVSFLAHYERYVQKKKQFYVYMPTFTIDRTKCKKTDEECYEFIVKTMTRPEINPVRLVIAKELTQKGEIHFHCLIKLRKTLTKHSFSGWTKSYGFIDIGKNKFKGRSIESQEDAIYQYITKDGNFTKIL